uniref:Uncharacterized protein n=1 Tax=Ursus maritimus TaxID=29073 RepID=A0A452UWT4_URSMA
PSLYPLRLPLSLRCRNSFVTDGFLVHKGCRLVCTYSSASVTPTDVSDRPKEGEVGVRKEVKYCHGTWGASFSKNVLGNVDCSRPESGHGKFADRPPFLCYSKLSVCVLSGIWDRLLIDPKRNCRKNSTLQTVRIERSPLLDQVQTFLPQMAQANEKLRKEMAAAPPGRFNIEDIDGALGKVIQMDVALFEMNQADSKEEDSSEESSQDSSEDSSESEGEDDSTSSEVTIDNIKLPHSQDGKGKIEVLDSPASKKKK